MKAGGLVYIDSTIPSDVVDLVFRKYGKNNIGFGYFCHNDFLMYEYAKNENRIMIDDSIHDEIGMYDVYVYTDKMNSKIIFIVKFSRKFLLLNRMNDI